MEVSEQPCLTMNFETFCHLFFAFQKSGVVWCLSSEKRILILLHLTSQIDSSGGYVFHVLNFLKERKEYYVNPFGLIFFFVMKLNLGLLVMNLAFN